MSVQDESAASRPAATTSVPRTPAPASWPWRRAALLLAGAAQLITIWALVGADPIPATWAALLLATAPAPLAAVTAFAPAAVARPAAVVTAIVLAAGIASEALHTGLFFIPALAVLAAGTLKLWRE